MLNKALQVAPGFLLALISLFAVAGSNHPHIDPGELTLLALALLTGFALVFSLAWGISRNFCDSAKVFTYMALLWLLFIIVPLLSKHFWKVYFDAQVTGILFVAFFGLLLLIRRSLPYPQEIQKIFFVFFLVTLSLQLPKILKIWGGSGRLPLYNEVETALAEKHVATLPHVVYIVPDRYASDGVLRDLYGFDNSGFSDALKARGFHVWDRQFANYPKTFQSLAATLNMNYIEELAEQQSPEGTSYVPVYRLIEDNQALRVLQRNGYGYTHLGNWWEPTRINPRADRQVTYERGFPEFTATYISVTPAAFLNTLTTGTRSIKDSCDLIRQQAEAIVTQASQSEKPLFFFWHLFSVHDPFLYDESGACRDYPEYGMKSPQDRATHYLNQITHTNAMLLNLIDRLQAASHREVIFLILSDEGPFPWEYLTDLNRYEFIAAPDEELRRKFSIYSALYLPSGNYGDFEKEKTSINAFRLIFNEIFAVDLPLQAHASYSFNRQTRPYDLIEITSRLHQ